MLILIIVILLLAYLFFYKKDTFVAPSYQIWNSSKDPLWFKYYGDKKLLPRGYSEEDFLLADNLIRDNWKK